MKVVGFTIIRNAIRFDYPIREAILSILPLCDEMVVAVGNSDDQTLELIRQIPSGKLRILETRWDDSLREGGRVLAVETDKALAAAAPDADWLFYIQADECVHEADWPVIRREMEATLEDPAIEGLLFRYRHFYGSYDYLGASRRWYRREIRLVKNLPGLHSYKDAQGFRIQGRKLRVKLIDAWIHHYGWVRPPQTMQAKIQNFNRMYFDDARIAAQGPVAASFDYSQVEAVERFEGTHPAVFQPRVAAINWHFEKDPSERRLSFTHRLLDAIERLTGRRLFEYRNYILVKP